jgi:hypothetical protein
LLSRRLCRLGGLLGGLIAGLSSLAGSSRHCCCCSCNRR